MPPLPGGLGAVMTDVAEPTKEGFKLSVAFVAVVPLDGRTLTSCEELTDEWAEVAV